MLSDAKLGWEYPIWRDFALGLRSFGHGPKPHNARRTWKWLIGRARVLRSQGNRRGAFIALNEARGWHDLSKGGE